MHGSNALTCQEHLAPYRLVLLCEQYMVHAVGVQGHAYRPAAAAPAASCQP